jgi:hypothetical protein
MQLRAMVNKSPSNPRDSRSNPSGVKDIEPAGEVGELASDARWLLAQRVTQSEQFRHSPRLRGFLLFIVERALRNCPAELVEYEIGIRAFDRTADFNPADDSIVRSSARLLRAKLKEYFAGEGRAEPLVIEVPKGGYAPEFVPRVPVEALVPQAARPPVAIYVLSAACVVLLAVCAFLWRSHAPAAPLSTGAPASTNLIFALFPAGAELNLVYGDAVKVTPGVLRPANDILDEYVRNKEQEPVAGSRLIAGYRDAAFGLRLGESASREGRVLVARHSRLMQARDFRAGNYLLLGGVLSNPWSALFEAQLNFRFEIDPSGQRRYGFRNVAPRAGEDPFYWFSRDEGRSAIRYARIALTPNLTGTGKVLTLAGQSAEGTEGAEDAALARDFPAQIQALLGNRPLHEVASFELLLEVHTMDGAARDTRILAYRVR